MTRRSLVKHLERFLLYPIISRLSFFLILRYGGVTHRQAVGGNGRTRFFFLFCCRTSMTTTDGKREKT